MGIATPGSQVAGFAAHFWFGSADDVVERNTTVNCDSGIGFGLDRGPNTDGIVQNNMFEYRFTSTQNVLIANNLMNRGILARDGAV
jgi:hypothetical protein